MNLHGTTGSFSRFALLAVALAGAAALFWPAALPAAEGDANPGDINWAEPAALAAESMLLDAAVDGARLIAVGERGHVLTSDDGGASWTQARVPTRSMFNAMAVAEGGRIWVVGHDAVIVHSADGGKSWSRQFYAPDLETPLLDVWFENASHGLAVGAYGLFLETHDGGKTWNRRDVDEEERHWNAITESADGTLYVAAEFGIVFRSRDKGKSWDALTTPYEGTFFGVLALSDGAVLIFGLRGNVYRSADNGQTWQHIKTDTTASLLNGIQCADGPVIIVGLSGSVLISRDSGASFTTTYRPDRLGIASLIELNSGALLLFGKDGVSRDDGLLRRQSKPTKGAPGGS